ncbi:MAG: phosphoribosylamine--glycine ligase [Deltaproteobacteria bacterium]|nr:phosphoribosylamine--glycine ligase [Deltaproteobacteria bacterium]MBM4322789.1 phosphoribosylamine--glycine ligase [Deltaproteobacteria bacterium]MBM4347225.1 phosphoribosylamine--glycine ligase [Deltaproteobacteria bacterium]
MKVLVVGGGGREHALVWKIKQSPIVAKVYCAPGNAGISEQATLVPIQANDLNGLLDFALKERINLTVVGPEEPLTRGIVDLFESKGLSIFGASQKAAELEGSKAFAKKMMKKYHLPTASYEVFKDRKKAVDYIRKQGAPIVVKADGLAAGKGVILCKTVEEAIRSVDQMMVEKIFGEAGSRVVIEEYLVGEEASYLAFTDGKTILPLASSQDHKAIFDGDEGPNTGGMGAYSPAPVVTDEVNQRIVEKVLRPIIQGMTDEGRPYKGIIYAGLMIHDGHPKVLEFNARFGDPETQPVLMRMKGDIIPILQACISGNLSRCRIEWENKASVCVVMASKGYPGAYEKGKVIKGFQETSRMEDIFVFHAGTTIADGKMVTNGGRVLGVTGLGENIPKAIERTYHAVEKIFWEGVHYRKDIGKKALCWL